MLPSAMVEMISVVVVSHEIYLRSKISGHKSFICRKCKCLLFLGILNKKRAWQSFESKLFISSKLHLKTRKKVWNILSYWKYRRLTLLGKITILKGFVASQLVYIMTPLCSNEKITYEINKLFNSFAWNGKVTKLKEVERAMTMRNWGGLKIINFSLLVWL